MAGISSKALNFGGKENYELYNDATEFNQYFDINIYETEFRIYDPQLGKFNQVDELSILYTNISTYTYAINNPILLNDPLGLSFEDISSLVPQPITSFIFPRIKRDQTLYIKDKFSIGQPSFFEEFIPVWGSGRAAVDDFQNGRIGMGLLNSGFALLDIFTFGGASTIIKGGARIILKKGSQEIAQETAEEGSKLLLKQETKKILLNEGINITEDRFIHLIQRHYPRAGMYLTKSKFTLSVREMVELIKKAAQVPKSLQNGGNFERIVEAGKIIGIDAMTGRPTTVFTIITNKAGDLITAFPGIPWR
jgi:RHS repeat-associated protein